MIGNKSFNTGGRREHRGTEEPEVLATHDAPGAYRSLLGVDADVIDEQVLRKNSSAIGRARPIAAHGDIQNDKEGMIENPGAAGGPLGFGERGVEMAVYVKTHHARLPLDSKKVKIIGKCLAGRQSENGCGVARARRRAGAVKRTVKRTVNRTWLLADVFHDVDFAARGPARGGDVFAKHPESRPHSLPCGNLDARLKATIGLAE